MDEPNENVELDDRESDFEENGEEIPEEGTQKTYIDDYFDQDDDSTATVEITGEKPADPARNRQLIMTLLAALIGAVLGPLPVILVVYITGGIFYPLFIAAPLLAFLFNNLLKGSRDIRSFIAIVAFSVLCTYFTAIACQATLYILRYGISFIEVFPLTFEAFGKSGVLPASASGYAYPVIFTAMGLIVDWELLKKQAVQSVVCEELPDAAV